MWDGHLESRKNPDRLKRSIYVDRIDVHSTFVRQAARRLETNSGGEDGNIYINIRCECICLYIYWAAGFDDLG